MKVIKVIGRIVLVMLAVYVFLWFGMGLLGKLLDWIGTLS